MPNRPGYTPPCRRSGNRQPRRNEAARSPECKARVLEVLRRGLGFESAAHTIGVGRKTLSAVRTEDPDFNRQCMEAIAAWEAETYDAVKVGFEKNPELALKVLERRFPWKWSTRTEMRITEKADPDADGEDEVAQMDDEALDKLAEGGSE